MHGLTFLTLQSQSPTATLLAAACVFLGGGLGSLLRWLVSLVCQHTFPSLTFPWPTLIVNAIGCAGAGVAMARLLPAAAAGSPARLLITVGLLGGFTTFSAFSLETIILARDGRMASATANIALNVVGGLGFTLTAYMLSRAAPLPT